MKLLLLLTVVAVLVSVPALGLAEPVKCLVDGSSAFADPVDLPANTGQGTDGRTIDIVGNDSINSSGTGRAKGNSYRVDIDVTLDQAEFWINFTDSQTLIYYVFVSPVEFGTYTEVYRHSEDVNGVGAAWYSSGMIGVPMTAGNHYIIAVSWSGFMIYYYGSADSQDTSFGAYTHGYATGFHPLPSEIESLYNDQAAYYQRLTTTAITPVEENTWGVIKAMYR